MKCIQALKENNNYKKGFVSRVENVEADLKVSTGYWTFVSKSLWKTETRGVDFVVSKKETKKNKKNKIQKNGD